MMNSADFGYGTLIPVEHTMCDPSLDGVPSVQGGVAFNAKTMIIVSACLVALGFLAWKFLGKEESPVA